MKVVHGKAKSWKTFTIALADQVYHETVVINPQKMEKPTSEIGNIKYLVKRFHSEITGTL